MVERTLELRLYYDDEEISLDVLSYAIKGQVLTIEEFITLESENGSQQQVPRLIYFYFTDIIYQGEDNGHLMMKSKTELAEAYFFDRIELFDGDRQIFEYHTSPEKRKNLLQKIQRQLPALVDREKKFEGKTGIYCCVLCIFLMIESLVYYFLPEFAKYLALFNVLGFGILLGSYLYLKPKMNVGNVLKKMVAINANFDRKP